MVGQAHQCLLLRIVKRVAEGLLVFTILAAFYSFFGGFMDYPCHARYEDGRNCIHARLRKDYSGKVVRSRIEAFLTVYKCGWSGGGCHRQYSESDVLEVETWVTRLRLERTAAELKVNGRTFKKGQEFQARTIFNLNPWTVADLSFKNLGLVTFCDEDSGPEEMALVGSYGTEFAPIKGLAILATLVAVRMVVKRKLNRLP